MSAEPNPKERFGAQKPAVGLVPSVGILHEAMAFENGAEKYGPYNWRVTGVEAMTYIHAGLRHIQNYLDGEEYARDSGVHNLGHARACLGIVLDAASVGKLIDNRPPPGRASALQEELKAQKIARAQPEAVLTAAPVKGEMLSLKGALGEWLR